MKKTTFCIAMLPLVGLTALLSTEASAEQSFSANVAVTSNYLWRGIEQTNGKSAISGGIDYSADSGFYVGAWVSNADWAPGMTYELDLYAGYAGQINDAVSFDVGYLYYAYPDEDSDDADFSEIYGNISFNNLTLGLAVLADAEAADFGDSIYATADYEFALASEATIALHLGSYSGDWLAEDSIDYGVSLSKDGFTLGISNTDLDDDDVKFYISYSIDIAL